MTEAEAALERSRHKAIRARLLRNFERFTFEAERISRNRGDDNWTCRLIAKSPSGDPIRGLHLVIKTPSPLSFDYSYEWALIEICPVWVEYRSPEGSIRFKRNVVKRCLP